MESPCSFWSVVSEIVVVADHEAPDAAAAVTGRYTERSVVHVAAAVSLALFTESLHGAPLVSPTVTLFARSTSRRMASPAQSGMCLG
jgi:hypothetical protein